MNYNRRKEVIEMIKTNYTLIGKIDEPEDYLQIAAVKENIDAVYFINGELSKEVEEYIKAHIELKCVNLFKNEYLKSILNHRASIVFAGIDQPLTFYQYSSIIRKHPRNIRFVDQTKLTPLEYRALCIIALEKDPTCYKLIRKFIVDEEIEDLAIVLNPENIMYSVFDTRPATQLLVIGADPHLIEYIKNPSDFTIKVSEDIYYI